MSRINDLFNDLPWAQFKALVQAKSLRMQYVEVHDAYWVKAFDGPFELGCLIQKLTPASADQTDFETNFQSAANSPLDARDATGSPIVKPRLPLPVYKVEWLKLDGVGTRNLNVNGTPGAGGPKHFDFSPPAGEEWDIEKILFGIDDAALTDFNLFGGITGLPQGTIVEVKVANVTYTLAVLKDNADIAMVFSRGLFVLASGVLDTADGYYGALELSNHIRLKGTAGDRVRFVVRDNLTQVNLIRAGVLMRRVLTNE